MGEHGPEQEQENYSFMQESVKDERVNPKKITQLILKIACKGIVFGLAACIGFFALKPWAETAFQKESEKVEIPQDEENNQEVKNEEEQENTDKEVQKLTIENYQELNDALGQVTADVKKSVVLIKGISQDESWEDEQNVSPSTTSGVIVADNGRELLILSNYSGIKDANLFQVAFIDGTEHEAVLKQKDNNIDMAIFSVAKSGITESTINRIKIATLGNSNMLSQGKDLIAVGSPFGHEGGIGYGIASTVNETVICADGKYNIIITDMPGISSGNGAIFDINGKLMGMIDTRTFSEGMDHTLTAISISSIKSEIELMSNGKNIPYIGIIGTVITKEMSEIYGMPVGIYVDEVEVDSPAMKAGIQNGDVITEIAGETITSLTELHSIIVAQEAGKTIKVVGQRRGTESYVDVKFNVTVGIKQ